MKVRAFICVLVLSSLLSAPAADARDADGDPEFVTWYRHVRIALREVACDDVRGDLNRFRFRNAADRDRQIRVAVSTTEDGVVEEIRLALAPGEKGVIRRRATGGDETAVVYMRGKPRVVVLMRTC